jgi:hypothetical protein
MRRAGVALAMVVALSFVATADDTDFVQELDQIKKETAAKLEALAAKATEQKQAERAIELRRLVGDVKAWQIQPDLGPEKVDGAYDYAVLAKRFADIRADRRLTSVAMGEALSAFVKPREGKRVRVSGPLGDVRRQSGNRAGAPAYVVVTIQVGVHPTSVHAPEGELKRLEKLERGEAIVMEGLLEFCACRFQGEKCKGGHGVNYLPPMIYDAKLSTPTTKPPK